MKRPFRRVAMVWSYEGKIEDAKSVFRYEFMTLKMPDEGKIFEPDFSKGMYLWLGYDVKEVMDNLVSVVMSAHKGLLDELNTYDYDLGTLHLMSVLESKEYMGEFHELAVQRLYPALKQEYEAYLQGENLESVLGNEKKPN